jgi:hypothetical protein
MSFIFAVVLFYSPCFACRSPALFSGSGIAARLQELREFPTMTKQEMVDALTKSANRYSLVLQSQDMSVLDVPSDSCLVAQETSGRPLCKDKATAEKLVDLLGDDMTSFNDVLTIAMGSGGQLTDKTLCMLPLLAFVVAHLMSSILDAVCLVFVCSDGYRPVFHAEADCQDVLV